MPPAALAIHLCIGMAYGFSVFWLPMTKLVAERRANACAAQGFVGELFTTSCNWTVPSVTHVFKMFIAVLGISAAIWGGWLEHARPAQGRSDLGAVLGRRLVLLRHRRLGPSALARLAGLRRDGGVGQGLGYITPVST